jgi:hypothetical protein
MSVATAYRRWQQDRQINARARARAAERQKQLRDDRWYKEYRPDAAWYGGTAKSREDWDREHEERRQLAAEAHTKDKPPLWARAIGVLVVVALIIGALALINAYWLHGKPSICDARVLETRTQYQYGVPADVILNIEGYGWHSADEIADECFSDDPAF